MKSLILLIFFLGQLSVCLSIGYAQVVPTKDSTLFKGSSIANEKKSFDFKEFTKGFPKIIKKNTSRGNSSQDRLNIELRQFDEVSYLKNLSSQTDSLLFQNTVDLERIRSIISEDPFSMDWAPTNELIQVSDQVQIDNVWITAFEYFSSWDTKKVDIYNIDIREFQDSVRLKLYDIRLGQAWSMPLTDILVNSRFVPRWGRIHPGVDLDLNTGDAVYTAFDGIIRARSYDRYGYGYYYVVRHKNGLETLYGHLSKHVMEVGTELQAVDLLGKGGSTGRSTGPHLHFELRYKGLVFDPEIVYDFEKSQLIKQELLVNKKLFSQLAKARAAAYHRVKRGDNLGSIARRYGVSVSQITRLNGISSRSILRIGQNLRVK